MSSSNKNWHKDIKAIIFDIGNTLINTENIIQNAAKYSAKKLVSIGLIKDWKTFFRGYIDNDRRYQEPHVNHLFSDLKIVKNTVKELQLNKESSVCGAFITYYRDEVRRQIHPNHSLYVLFELLKSSGKRLGIISDGTTIEQLETLTRLDVIHFFDVIIISEEIGFEKPSEEIFGTLIKLLDLNPSNMLIVGDNYIRDIVGGIDSGFRTALLTEFSVSDKNEFKPNYEPNIVIGKIDELKKLFDL